jgi:SAM-dependent methyltransferase
LTHLYTLSILSLSPELQIEGTYLAMRYQKYTYPWYIFKNLFKNFLMFLMPSAINRIRQTTGTGNPQLDQDIVQIVEYSKGVFEKYCRYMAKKNMNTTLNNKTIVELGPGDTMATAFFFLAYGAKRVVCFDRFKLLQNTTKNTLIAQQVLSILPEQQRQHLQTILSFDDLKQVRWDPIRLQYLHNRYENITLENNSVDIILSNAVLEHVQNLDVLFSHMYRILKPGGIMVHAADLKSHELHHATQLDFLTIPSSLWKYMTFYRGAPNRARKTDYEKLINHYGFELTFFKFTSRIPQEDIHIFIQKYPNHAANFATEDLSCGGFLFAAKKL